MRHIPIRQTLTHRARQEQYHDHRRCDPEWTIEIRVTVKHIQKVAAREDGGSASPEHIIRIDVEELSVEGDGPEVFLGLDRGGGGGRALVAAADVAVRGRVLGGCGVEVCGMVSEDAVKIVAVESDVLEE